MTTPQIMAYVQTGAVAAPDNTGALPDFVNNVLYLTSSGNNANSGIHKFDGYPNGTELYAKTISQLLVPEIHSVGAGICAAGMAMFNQYTSNSTTICELYMPTGTLASQFGIPGSSLSPSDNTRILTSGSMAPVRWGNVNYIMSTPLVSGFGEVCLLSVPGQSNQNLGPITENQGFCGPGAVGPNSGTAFVLGVGGTTNLGLYRVVVTLTGNSMTRSGSITPASVDATWTAFAAAAGCAFDQTDGNPIIYVHTTGKTVNDYLVKLNATTAAVIWKCAIDGSTAKSQDMANWLITKQTIYFLGLNHTLYTINTATGAATTQVISDLTANGAMISEDLYGSIIGYGSWVENGTHPEYIGDYMGTGGNHSLTNTWFRYMFAPISPPSPPGPPAPGIISVNRTWSYTQDGHTFYVMDLGTQGTFLYDETTNEWCEYQTAGGQWNMTNGVMWSQRVVAGDITGPDLWELDPAATKDAGGTYELTHTVTGGLMSRSRTFISLSAFRVAASFGIVDDTGVTFNLRYSDDQGATWQTTDPITLVAGAFSDEIAWRSLGSFMAPGRIFELSDAGGLIRIDGADAFLDGFDNDSQTQGDGGGD